MSFAGGFIDLFGNGDKSRITKRNGKEVKGFIEVKVSYDGMGLVLPVSGIKTVAKRKNGCALIEFESVVYSDKPKDGVSLIDTVESYEEVKRKIQSEV